MKKFAVVFDMDGVLVDSNPYHKVALKQFCEGHGYHLSEMDLRTKIYGRTNKDWITNLFGELPEDQLKKFADEKEALFRELYKNDIQPVEGLKAFLDLLRDHQVPVAIATSAPMANVDFVLSSLNLGDYFETILDDTFVSKGKPNPEIYLKSAKALDMEPMYSIVIEDSISGVQAGKAAGCPVIGITTTHTKEELRQTDLVISDFRALTISDLENLVD